MKKLLIIITILFCGLFGYSQVTPVLYPQSTRSVLAVDNTGYTFGIKQTGGMFNIIVDSMPKPYYVRIAEGNVSGNSPMFKFGSNPDVGTGEETIWTEGGLYNWAGVDAAPGIVKVSSSAVADGGTAQVETATVGSSVVTGSGNAMVVVTSAGMTGTPDTVSVPVYQGTLQVETQSVVGTATSSGNMNVIVTGGLVAGSPLTVPVAIVGGTKQIETATIVATITTSGSDSIVVTGALVDGSPLTLPIAVTKGVAQIETQTVVGTTTVSGNMSVVVTGSLVTGSPKTIAVPIVSGTYQIETATIADTVATSGYASIIVTGALVTGSPLTIPVYVVKDDLASVVATKVKAALNASVVKNNYHIGGTGAEVSLTTIIKAANDTTLNIELADGTSSGLTPDSTSANTTAGVTPDIASLVGGKVRTALGIAAITDNYTVGGSGANITLTTKVNAVNDATLNIAYTKGTATGLTADLVSVNTLAGAPFDNDSLVAIKVRTALGIAAITGDYTVGGTGDEVSLTALVKAANDTTLNIEMVDGTAVGLTADSTSGNTEAGVAPDLASAIGGKIRTALGIAAITDNYDVGGSGANVSLTTKVVAANDATLNIAYTNGTAAGLTADATSVNTEAGVNQDSTNSIATKIRAALIADAVIGHPITGKFVITGAGADIILTSNPREGNDTTLNVSIVDSTSTGVATAANSANTTAGASATGLRTCTIYGLSLTGIEQSELIALNGQAAVNSTLSYIRVNNIVGRSAGSGLKNAGKIYVGTGTVTSGVPAVKWAVVDTGKNQTQTAVYTVPYDKILYLTNYLATTNSNKGNSVTIYARPLGEIFQIKADNYLFSTATSYTFQMPLRIEGGTDIDCRSIGVATGAGIGFSFESYIQ